MSIRSSDVRTAPEGLRGQVLSTERTIARAASSLHGWLGWHVIKGSLEEYPFGRRTGAGIPFTFTKVVRTVEAPLPMDQQARIPSHSHLYVLGARLEEVTARVGRISVPRILTSVRGVVMGLGFRDEQDDRVVQIGAATTGEFKIEDGENQLLLRPGATDQTNIGRYSDYKRYHNYIEGNRSGLATVGLIALATQVGWGIDYTTADIGNQYKRWSGWVDQSSGVPEDLTDWMARELPGLQAPTLVQEVRSDLSQ